MSTKYSSPSKRQAKEEELFWVRVGESRLADFNRDTAMSHKNAWNSDVTQSDGPEEQGAKKIRP